MIPLPWLDLVLPGAGLVIRGRLSGLALLLPALACLTLASVGSLLIVSTLRPTVAGAAVATYLLLGVIGLLWHHALVSQRDADPAVVRRLHRAAATAWLAGHGEVAVQAARDLVRAAPAEPGAWELLALVGDGREAQRAHRHGARLARERDEGV